MQACVSEGSEFGGVYEACTGDVRPFGCVDGVDGRCSGSVGCMDPACSMMSTCVPPPSPPTLCTNKAINNEPEILAAYSPASGETVGANGQIKVWVTDENPPFIAPGEQVDPNTGAITTPGDRTAKAPDGYLWEPALYISPQTAASGGTPHFPQLIKGSYNNNPPTRGTGTAGAPMDPLPAGSPRQLRYTGEDIWDVNALGLAPGTYSAEFLIFDGDKDRGVGCVTIVITP
jgi:hypothetical protein